MQGHIHTVSGITRALKDAVEAGFPFVWVRGQVSNLSRPSSGHIYFSLKDEGAALSAVWFRKRQRAAGSFDPLTGEVYEENAPPSLAGALENGMEVLAAGGISIYEARGTYQLLVEIVMEEGEGRLKREMEALRRRLEALGYFAQERKRPLPANPLRVAVVTAPGGAAIHDFLRIARRRGSGCEIRIFPSLVQGEKAPEAIVAALAGANATSWPQVIALIRGGGAAEDLQAFNDAGVARAIFESAVPVVAGIGHEVDVTFADLVADVRAATPSHAAQLLWTERAVLADRLEKVAETLCQRVDALVERRQRMLAQQARTLGALSPRARLGHQEERFSLLVPRLVQNMKNVLRRFERREDALGRALREGALGALQRARNALLPVEAALGALDPSRPMEQGYALVRLANGSFARSVREVRAGDLFEIILQDGIIAARALAAEEERTEEKTDE